MARAEAGLLVQGQPLDSPLHVAIGRAVRAYRTFRRSNEWNQSILTIIEHRKESILICHE